MSHFFPISFSNYSVDPYSNECLVGKSCFFITKQNEVCELCADAWVPFVFSEKDRTYLLACLLACFDTAGNESSKFCQKVLLVVRQLAIIDSVRINKGDSGQAK